MALPRYIPHYTLEDYLKWEGSWELWSGVPVAMSPSADKRHQRLASALHFLLKSALKQSGCSKCEVYFELDWVASEENVFRPDLLIVCDDNPSRYLETTPVFIAEILSESTRQRDLVYKRECYLQLGVRYYLIVDPEKESLDLLSLEDGRYVEADSQTLALTEGCEIRVDFAEAFAELS